MKKIILAVAAVALAVSVNAQNFTWGVKGGLNLANVSNTDANIKPSIYLGAFGEYKFNDFIGLSPELVYSRQGAADSHDGNKYKDRLNYINIPVLAKLYLVDNLSLDLGPQFGFMLNANAWSKIGGTKTKTDIGDAYKAFDLSFGIGVTYDLGKILLQARYNLGLTDINDTNLTNDKFKNNVIQLGVGYRF